MLVCVHINCPHPLLHVITLHLFTFFYLLQFVSSFSFFIFCFGLFFVLFIYCLSPSVYISILFIYFNFLAFGGSIYLLKHLALPKLTVFLIAPLVEIMIISKQLESNPQLLDDETNALTT